MGHKGKVIKTSMLDPELGDSQMVNQGILRGRWGARQNEDRDSQ